MKLLNYLKAQYNYMYRYEFEKSEKQKPLTDMLKIHLIIFLMFNKLYITHHSEIIFQNYMYKFWN